MLRRGVGAHFAGGAYVFPGGAVDRSDRDPGTMSLAAGRDDREASEMLAVESEGLGYFVAAIRECFEEAGLLFAEGSDGLVSFADTPARERFQQYRNELNAGTTTLAAICRAEGLTLAVTRLRYFSHWITPPGAPRRFDTRFFVGVAPESQAALHDDAEVVASEWLVPSRALERHVAGELDLMFPTVKHLQALSSFASSRELWDAATVEVPTIQPRISVDGTGLRILLPDDPDFDQAPGLPDGFGFPEGPSGGGRD